MTSVNAAVERESFRREFRERDETWEDTLKLGLVERGAIEGLIRISYEHARRGGSEYHENPYEAFYSASLGPYPTASAVAVQSWFHSIAQFRSFDLADRRQDLLNARVNYAFDPAVDGAMTVQLKDADFPAGYGRSGHQRTQSVTLDLTWQAGAAGELYGFYAYQNATGNQLGVAPGNCVIGTAGVTAATWRALCGSASATSPLFPESRAWEVNSKDRNDVIGLGLRYDLGATRLDASFSRTLGRTKIGYAYNAAALGLSAVQASLAGDGLSDMTFAQNVLSANLLVPIDKSISMRVLVRYESGRIRDWHYEGLAGNPMPTNNTLYLDAGPQDYRTTAVGLFLQVRL
jgi:predicted porin